MLKYIFAALAAATIWAVVLVFQLPLWIAIAAAVLVVLAHVVLFWWFLCKGRKDDRKDDEQGDR